MNYEFEDVSLVDLENEATFTRILNKRFVDEKTGCWEWLGARSKSKNGHGMVSLNGQMLLVHRVIAFLCLGIDLDDERRVLHHCDNVICFNPEHLYLGTDTDNMRDRVVRGKLGKTAKLTADDIVFIRSSSLSGKELAEKYGVQRNHIYRIKNGHRWFHLKEVI